MKKQLTLILMLITSTIFTSCKKNDYENDEYYKISYQTINKVMSIHFFSNQTLHQQLLIRDDSGKVVVYQIVDNFNNNFNLKADLPEGKSKLFLDFKKVSGETVTIEMPESDKLINTTR